MNGNISNNIEGAFKKVKNIGSKKFSSVSLKKLISSNKFIIIINIKKMNITLKRQLKYLL